jgi:hypothetical protein
MNVGAEKLIRGKPAPFTMSNLTHIATMPINPLFEAHFRAENPINVQIAYQQYFKGNPPSIWHCITAINDAGLTETVLGTAKDIQVPVSYLAGANNGPTKRFSPTHDDAGKPHPKGNIGDAHYRRGEMGTMYSWAKPSQPDQHDWDYSVGAYEEDDFLVGDDTMCNED